MAKHVIDDSPGGLAILLSRKHGSGDDMGPAPAAKGDDKLPAGLEDGAQDLLDAIRSDDATKVAHALMDCYSLCGGEGDEPDGDEGGEAASDEG